MRRAAIFNWLVYRSIRLGRESVATRRWRIGIYKVDRLGDFVLSVGAIRAIIEIAGVDNCVLIHSAASSQMARREFQNIARVEIPPLDGKLWVTRRRLRRLIQEEFQSGGVGQMLCLRHFRSLADEVALRMIPSSEVWCVRNSNTFSLDYELVRSRFEGDVVVDRPARNSIPASCEDLACHESLLRRWAGPKFAGRDVRPRIESNSRKRDQILAVSPFGSDRIRDLPLDRVAACVIHGRVSFGLSSVLLAPPDDLPRYQAFAAHLAEKGAIASVLVTRTGDDLVDALAGSAVVLTTETATAHIATALDRPMVCLIGGGHYGQFAPWRLSNRQVWITSHIPCFNCNWHCMHPEPYCITRVAAEQLIQGLRLAFEASTTIPIQVNA